jgi:hypothetical protein
VQPITAAAVIVDLAAEQKIRSIRTFVTRVYVDKVNARAQQVAKSTITAGFG